ncbi:hypothetical protein CC53_gp067 [Rhizobium phage vB_RleS_L338C]|uniref:hypothetical protein n=1 Tax=Rhizobium phage vB_RleS_L338C TaxID=1414737 RepID=UPI0003D8F866|nr:hypothetical protein CC53_gp067 [Rhizobium phage vB_RleS_L338C]AHC30484.1 hypothetical protein L338C_067 [Rhizobium phage vB_RleS_L338C]QNH72101.1 hypothetical protein P11VFA_079 [Rhizobium phage P11VFA]
MTAAAATDKTYKDRNARRRARYAEDPAYRQSIIERERSKRTTVVTDCRENLAHLETFGHVREYHKPNGVVDTGLTFTIEEAASAMGRTPKSLYKYYSKDMFPRPVYTVKGPTGLVQEAYTETQMRALINVFGAHLAETPYYGVYHKQTRAALFGCIGQ